MNHLNEITTHSERLPENLQKEVLDFICFLEERYSFKSITQNKHELTDEEIEKIEQEMGDLLSGEEPFALEDKGKKTKLSAPRVDETLYEL